MHTFAWINNNNSLGGFALLAAHHTIPHYTTLHIWYVEEKKADFQRVGVAHIKCKYWHKHTYIDMYAYKPNKLTIINSRKTTLATTTTTTTTWRQFPQSAHVAFKLTFSAITVISATAIATAETTTITTTKGVNNAWLHLHINIYCKCKCIYICV